MSGNGASSSNSAPTNNAVIGEGSSSSNAAPSDQNQIVLQFLERRGYHRAAAALQAEIASPSTTSNQQPASLPAATAKALTADEFANRNAPAASNSKAKEDSLQKWRQVNDPSIYETGYKSLRAFVEGSLEMHRVELQSLLWPVFVHVYLDLVAAGDGFRLAADALMARYGGEYDYEQHGLIQHLKALQLPEHLQESGDVRRWRTEKYMLTLSERGWGLLQSWLIGGNLSFHDPAAKSGSVNDKGRDKVLSIINERLEIKIVPGLPKGGPSNREVGLQSDLFLKGIDGSYSAFMPLKLGQIPRDPKLEREVNRVLQETGQDVAPTQHAQPGMMQPSKEDEPPLPPSFRVADIKREVEKIREARKRIRLGPEAYAGPEVMLASHHELPKDAKFTAAKPSVCLFTMHDTLDTMTSCTMSDDCTILAAGFADSYIRLWNLKGKPFQPMHSDFDPEMIKSSSHLKQLKNQLATSTTIKLIGHSGPVYALSFDPLEGPADSPRYLLSASQDGTVRLWSLDTLTNVVVYKGHRDPVWDVEWSPKGVYFATASRDRTARIWCTDRTAPLRILAGHLSDVDCVRFHPNGLYVATGSSDRTCRLWDVQRGTCVRVFPNGHSAPVSCIAFSPDGRYLASGGNDHLVNLWDLSTGRLIKTMRGHTSRIQSLAFSQESALLVSGATDDTIRIWDVLSRPVQPASTATASIKNLGLSAGPGSSNPGGLSLSMSTNGGAIVSSADGRTSATLGIVPKSAADAMAVGEDKNAVQSPDLLGLLLTKRTPITSVKFTEANLLIALGSMRKAA